jgi:hypothetical protein
MEEKNRLIFVDEKRKPHLENFSEKAYFYCSTINLLHALSFSTAAAPFYMFATSECRRVFWLAGATRKKSQSKSVFVFCLIYHKR